MYSDAVYDDCYEVLQPGSDQMTKHEVYFTFKHRTRHSEASLAVLTLLLNGEVGIKSRLEACRQNTCQGRLLPVSSACQ